MSMSHAQADGVEYSSQARLTYSERGPKPCWLEFLVSEIEVGQLLKSINSLGGFAELSRNGCPQSPVFTQNEVWMKPTRPFRGDPTGPDGCGVSKLLPPCYSQRSIPSGVEWKQAFFIQHFSTSLPTKTGSLTVQSSWLRGWHILQAGYRSFFKSYSKFAELEIYLFKFFRLSYINMSKAA